MEEALLAAVETARGWIDDASRVVVLTGAGISTDSGIPDFRGPNGVWTKNPKAERQANLQHYLANPDARREAWLNRLDHRAWTAEPNPGHHAIVELERRGKLLALLTQNVDGLHHEAGSDPALVVEVHGTLREVMCMACGAGGPMQDTLDRVRAGEADPPCLDCGGILKSATISFGQNLVVEDLVRAERVATQCDVLVAVGTTLTVYPIADVVPTAKQAGAKVVILNAEPTPFDPIADAVLRGSISEVLPALFAARTGSE